MTHLQNSPLLPFALFASLFMVIFNFTLPNMASIYIVGDLGGSNDIASYSISFFALGNALGVPLGRALYAQMGTLRLFFRCMLLFSFFSLLCGLAPNWEVFIASRFLQGLSSGPLYVLINLLLGSVTPPEKRDWYGAITMATFTIVPAVGASWGGWIAYDYFWRWNFYIDVPILLALAALVWQQTRSFHHTRLPGTFDKTGYLFFFIGVFCLACSLILGQELDWHRSWTINSLWVIGGISFVFFVLWALHHPNPIIELRLFKHIPFAVAIFTLGVMFTAYFGMIMLLALWLGLYVNYTPLWIGVIIGTMAFAGLFPFVLLLKRFKYIDCRWCLFLGMTLFAASSFYSTIFSEEIDLGRLAISRIVAGFAFAFSLPSLFRLAFHTFDQENTLKVIGIFQAVRGLGSGLGASIYTTIWLRRQVFYHDRLGSQLTEYSPVTAQFFVDAQQFGITGDKAYAHLEDLLQRRATALALDDCFWLMGWIIVGLGVILLMTFLCKRTAFVPEKCTPQTCATFRENQL